MKNITVSVDDEVYRKARVAAASRDTSVSALVREFLNSLSPEDDTFEMLKTREKALREDVKAFRGADRLSRDDVHRRGR